MKKNKSDTMLLNLRKLFRYHANGKPDIYSYGVFKAGITTSEMDDYIRVRLNSMNIKKVRAKINDMFIGSTCPIASFDDKSVGLMYRHDVERFADAVIDKIPTYFD